MNIRRLPKTERQISPKYIQTLGIQSYDVDNLYPQSLQAKIAASKVASGCLARYSDYIEGLGLNSQVLGSFAVNDNGETFNALHRLVSRDYAEFGGFAIHVNYDVYGRIVELQHVPFESVRLVEPNEDGAITKVAIHPDWSEHMTRAGKIVKVNKANTEYIDVFDPDPATVSMQILRDGGIEEYKGQVLYYSNEGHLVYPVPSFASVLTDMSTDEGLSNLALRNARMNFLPAGVYIHYKDRAAAPLEEDGSPFAKANGYSEDLAKVQGDMNAMKIIDCEIDSPEDKPEFLSFEGKNIDGAYVNTSNEVKEAIYAAFGQEGWLAIRNGKVGFSGTLMADISEEYSAKMRKSQKVLSETYYKLLTHWTTLDPLPELVTPESVSIVPMIYTPSSSIQGGQQQ